MAEHSPYKHIHADFRHLAEAENAVRLQFLQESRWIGYKTATAALDTLLEMKNTPKRARMPNLLIIGGSNNGKTTLIRRFVKLNGEPYVDEEENNIKPIILAESPPVADEKQLLISLLEKLEVPYNPSDNISKLRYQVIHLFKTFDTKMLIIDEFHSLLTGTAKQQQQVMNSIKFLCNELNIPIVGVGTRDAIRVLHTDAQHASRFDIFELPTWRLDKEFQKLLFNIEGVLPLKNPSNLVQADLVTRIHSISEGNLGNVYRLLTACAKAAINSGTEQITTDIIEEHSWLKPTKGYRQIY